MTPPPWYLTVARKAGPCTDCGKWAHHGDAVVYCHAPRHVLCIACGKRRGLKPHRSRAYLASRHARTPQEDNA